MGDVKIRWEGFKCGIKSKKLQPLQSNWINTPKQVKKFRGCHKSYLLPLTLAVTGTPLRRSAWWRLGASSYVKGGES